ncbi:MAG: hypothetical protein AAGD96_03140 [Chloroflexota bacterium]
MNRFMQTMTKWLNGLLLAGGMLLFGIGPVFNASLPPRPPDIPVETEDPIKQPTTSVSGAKIMFQAQSANFDADDWTVIEWQTADGGWVEVEGWQGTFSSQDGQWQVEWWVGSDQLDSGPYRWIVYPNQAKGAAEFVSEPFYLPDVSGDHMSVE